MYVYLVIILKLKFIGKIVRLIIIPYRILHCRCGNVYGAASNATLRSLDVVTNEALRITSGAFKATPCSRRASLK